jgi:hypothetical protein
LEPPSASRRMLRPPGSRIPVISADRPIPTSSR